MGLKKYIRLVLVYFVYVLLFSLLQFFWPAGSFAGFFRPDWQLVVAAACGYLYGFKDGIVVGLCLGLIRDCLSARYFGLGLLILFCVGGLASVVLSKRWSRSLVTLFAVVFILTVGVELFSLICQMGIARRADFGFWPGTWRFLVTRRLLPRILMNLVATLPVFICFRYLGPYPYASVRANWSNLRREGAYLD